MSLFLRRHLEKFLFVKTGKGMLLAPSGWRTGVLHRTTTTTKSHEAQKMSAGFRLRNFFSFKFLRFKSINREGWRGGSVV